MIYKNSLISLVMIAAVGVAISTTILSFRPSTKVALAKAITPDAIMEDVVALVLDKEGNPKIKIVTPKMIHFTENDTANLTTPKITLYRQSPKPWYVTAKYAKSTQGIDNIDFWDDVVINHPEDQKNPTTTITTTILTVHPNQQTAETKSFITMTQPHLIVKAEGMFADMNTGNIKLLTHARGEYVPF